MNPPTGRSLGVVTALCVNEIEFSSRRWYAKRLKMTQKSSSRRTTRISGVAFNARRLLIRRVTCAIPETRFHFKTEVLRFGRVGCICICPPVNVAGRRMQHEARFYMSGKNGSITCVTDAGVFNGRPKYQIPPHWPVILRSSKKIKHFARRATSVGKGVAY